MIKRGVLSFISLILLIVAVPVTAQEAASSWEILLFESTTGQVISVTPTGIETKVTLSDFSEFRLTFQQTVSPDGRLMAFGGIKAAEDRLKMAVYVANLETGECCQELPDPLPAGMDYAVIGPFNPESNQLVTVVATLGAFDAASAASFITVYDLTQGAVVATLPPSVLQAEGEEPLQSAVFGKWDAEGIQVAPTCANCEPQNEGTYQIWDPSTDALKGTEVYFDLRQQVLAGTGESIMSVLDENYPSAEAQESMLVLPNVVEYFPIATTQTDPIVIYFNPGAVQIRDIGWILDGSAMLVTHAQNPLGAVVFRDGTQFSVEVGSDSKLLAGTPDGWVMVDVGNVIHFQLVDGQLTSTGLGMLDGRIGLIQTPRLGSTATPGFAAP